MYKSAHANLHMVWEVPVPNSTAILAGTLWMVVNTELKPGEYDIGWASHCLIHVISRGPSVVNFRKDAELEHESIQGSSYHHFTLPQIQDKQ